MSDLTKNMRPVCFGRLVIEIPTVSKIRGWEQTVDDTIIESLDHPSPSRKAFDTKITQREKLLRTSPNDTDGVLFKNRIRLTPESELLVYRKGKVDHRMYQLDALFWQPSFEYLFHTETTNKYLDTGIARITKVVNNYHPTPPTIDLLSIPTGLCIEHGVVIGNEFRGESVSIGGLIEEYPGLFFSFSTESTDRGPEEPKMIARIERSFGMGDAIGKEVSAATRFIRKGNRKLNGQDGQELVMRATLDGVTHMSADAEFYGEPNSLDKPDIKVSLSDQTHDDNTHKPYNKNLTEKEFLALWDALLNGIKPRPKNQWGADSIKK
ncbi:MAG: hypothetical protein KKH12_10360 [Gammaproteobacteria bacterium]|nr:hypothetical protein [Gammaproteobacteria bacterium]MBU1482063.1 hypothetical protein [Gammaproteobacteria bacterium]